MPVAAKRERRKEARPMELMEAALDVFVEKGFAAARVEDVAQKAGVSKGTLFLYFATKVDLFKAVVRHNISGRLHEWNEAFDSYEGSTADMVRFCMMQWWERIGATKASGITKLIMAEATQFPELAAFYRQEVVQPGHALIRRILERGIQRGEFRPVDLHLTTYSIVAPMIFAILWRHSLVPCGPQEGDTPEGAEPFDPVAFIAHQADVLIHGLRVNPHDSGSTHVASAHSPQTT